jgi:predicted CoA-binding protein
VILKTPDQIRKLLERSKSIAVVGASENRARPSYGVFSYLSEQGRYAVAPVNPAISEIDGSRAYPTLQAYAAENGPPDIVDVFRNASAALEVTNDAIAAGAKAIWYQFGVINDEAIELADRAGLDVVVDRCLKIDHAASGLA